MQKLVETLPPREREHKHQVAGFFITPEWVHEPWRAEEYIRRMANDGYAVTAMFWRYFNLNLYSGGKQVHDCIKEIVSIVHKYGMRCMLDTDVCWWGQSLCDLHPECCQKYHKSEIVKVRDGKFHFCSDRVQGTKVMSLGHQIFDGLEAYGEIDGQFQRINKELYTFDWQNIYTGYEIKGEFKERIDGDLVFFVTMRCSGTPDVAHEEYLNAQNEIIGRLADTGLDGFGWDEPAKGSQNPLYLKSGEGFLKLFKSMWGYDLVDKLPYMYFKDDTAEAVEVRLHYYEALNKMNIEAQRLHNEYAEKVAGRKLIFGTHQTWSGLIADLAGGITDYFNAGKVLTAAWTDGSWDTDLRCYAFHLLLADSIRNELGLEDAYYNDWGSTVPAVENMHFATRFKMLYHVNWFNIWYSDSTDQILNYRLEPLHRESVKDVTAMDQFDRFLSGMKTQTEAGIVYNWKSTAAAPKWLTRYNYTASTNIAQTLLDQGITANFISEESLKESTFENGTLICSGRKLQVLVLPHCYVIDDKCWQVVRELAAKRFPVVFLGVPPMFTTSGKCIKEEFAKLLGVEKFDLKDVYESIAEEGHITQANEWELEFYDAMHIVIPTDGEAIYDAEKRIMAVKGANNSAVYMTGIDPREDLANLLNTYITRDTEVYAQGAYYNWFCNADGSEKVLIVSAVGRMPDVFLGSCRTRGGNCFFEQRKRHEMRCFVRTAAETIRILKGSWCAIRFKDGKATDYIGDADVSVE